MRRPFGEILWNYKLNGFLRKQAGRLNVVEKCLDSQETQSCPEVTQKELKKQHNLESRLDFEDIRLNIGVTGSIPCQQDIYDYLRTRLIGDRSYTRWDPNL
jgi:hypothetical protein